ncbi:hypothetical protein ACJX0J_018565, partial [Zea mays]
KVVVVIIIICFILYILYIYYNMFIWFINISIIKYKKIEILIFEINFKRLKDVFIRTDGACTLVTCGRSSSSTATTATGLPQVQVALDGENDGQINLAFTFRLYFNNKTNIVRVVLRVIGMSSENIIGVLAGSLC